MSSIGNSRAVLPPCNELDPGPDLLRQRLFRGSQVVRDQPFREAFRNDVCDLLPKEFVAAVSELFLGLNVSKEQFLQPPFTTTIASGAASSSPRYLPSSCARCFSAALRTLLSWSAAVTRGGELTEFIVFPLGSMMGCRWWQVAAHRGCERHRIEWLG